MTSSNKIPSSSGGEQPHALLKNAQLVIQLALGISDRIDDADRDWPAVLDFAIQERCAAIAWLLSGSAIAAHADPLTARRWADAYHAACTKGHTQLMLLGSIAQAALESEVHCVVLKGPPLAQQLYGDPGVRCSDDLDVYVSQADRRRMRDLVSALGWTFSSGSDLGDETWVLHLGESQFYLEIHSSLTSSRLSYLRAGEPEWTTVPSEGISGTIRVHRGALLPSYLAASVAKHQFSPLARTIDVAALWSSLGESDRAAAYQRADESGLRRHLAWALKRTDALSAAARGDVRELRALGFSAGARSDVRPFVRDVLLAPSTRDSVRAITSYIWPPWLQSQYGGVVTGTLRRIRYHWRAGTLGRRVRDWKTLMPARRNYDARGARSRTARVPEITGEALAEVVRSVTNEGGRMWFITTGTSMVPTIRAGDRVLLTPVRGDLNVGDIVFVEDHGQPLLHRIERLIGEKGGGGNSILTRGDACPRSEGPFEAASVLARVERAERAGRAVRLDGAPRIAVGRHAS
ncbi:MAG: nucleotidyltransferase family protein [Gemmatimonadaceae bacterium]